MKKIMFRTVVVVVIAFGCSLLVNAQATRTWVSGVGDDVNPCSRTAPCKTFAGAISKTATNGEISCLDPGGFGAVTITKSITIDCVGTLGSILASGTNGVVINITAVADIKKAVRLRGLTIDGAATGLNGIRFLAGNSLNVENVVIDGFTTHGISIETTSGTKKVAVDNSTIRGNAGNGINTFITSGSVNLAISNSLFSSNNVGVNLANNTKATIRASELVNNATGLVAGTVDAALSGCMISGNTTGMSALSGANVRIADNTITSNSTGLSISGGTITTFSNNMIFGNTVDGSPNAFQILS
jgi:Right handed beta helix region